MENSKFYFQKFKIAIGIFVATLVVFVLLISNIVPKVQKIAEIQKNYKEQSTALIDAERKVEELKKSAEDKKQKNENQSLPKAFFKPISMGLDTESAISDEFGEILQTIRENKIKTRSVKYDYDPQDDNFVKNAPANYQVCRVTAQLVANYASFEKFLRDLYKHEHFLEISKIEIAPYQKNKKILLIDLQFKLYAQRDPSTYVAPAVPEPPKTEKSESDSPDKGGPKDIGKKSDLDSADDEF